jgi:hypothetical protein
MMYQALTENVLSALSPAEINQLFSLVTDNVDLFDKIMPQSPFIAQVKHGEPLDHVLMHMYQSWLITR